MSSKCSQCSLMLEADAAFCAVCGTPALPAMRCPKCQGTVSGEAKFCKYCAFELEVTQVRPLPPPTYNNPQRETSTLFQDYAMPVSSMSGNALGETSFRFGLRPVVAAAVLLLVISASTLAYISSLRTQTQQLNHRLAEKEQTISAKEQEVNDKRGQVASLEYTNSGLSDDLEEKKKQLDKKDRELTKRLAEVKNLQGSVKTVGRCLVGVVGVLKAVQEDNREMALSAARLIDSTCQEAGGIIKRVEGFPTGAAANQ